jgi:hypothetical protein
VRGFEIITIVIGIFFALGIAAGVLLVISLPLLRGLARNRRNGRQTRKGRNWQKLSSPDDDRRPPRWPGG